ncbi:MAG: hypothetical protein KatS3mg051_1442 [Anaerolineae bacterium]|nr:MAG: hypothetical protein KatS3mg051_1442 [Anaerolineae bacterium]
MTIVTASPSYQQSNERRLRTDPIREVKPDPDATPPAVWPKWALLLRQEYESKLAAAERRIAELESTILAARKAEREMNDKALTIYGKPNALPDVVRQVSLSPKFATLTPEEHEYVARVALATGLNPEFHIHAWTDKRRVKTERGWETVRQLTVTPDYKALIQMARRQHLMLKERRLTPDEMRERGIPERDIAEGAIAYVIEGYELDKAILARQAGIEYEPLRGFGWWAAMKDETVWNEQQRRMVATGKRVPNDVPNGRDGAWVAWKRAMRALYNQLADLTLKFAGPAPNDEGDWTLSTPDPDGSVVIIDAQVVEDARPALSEQPSAAQESAQPAAGEVPAPAETVAADEPAPDSPAVSGDAQAVDPAPSEQPPAPQPASKPRRKQAMCRNCQVEPADPTNPVDPALCPTCARNLADAKAARS